MNDDGPSRFYIYVGCVTAASIVVFVSSWLRFPVDASWVLFVLVLGSVAAENLAVELPSGGSASIAYPVSLAALLLFGPSAAAMTAAFSGLSLLDIRQRKAPSVIVFNIAQLTLSAGLSGLVYVAVLRYVLPQRAGTTLMTAPLATADFPAVVVPLVAVAVVSVLLNNTLVGAGISLYRGVSFREIWLENVAWAIPTHLALASLGAALAQIVATVGPLGFALFVVPLIVTSQTYQHYVYLKSAYADAIRSLVVAIEAKDPYTRGHSERVSEYAVQISGALGFAPEAVQQIEIGALLHDLGKLGISRRILAKPGRLTDEEMDRIRDHPRMGAHIIESIPFLAALVPSILYHHERLDGLGYGEGLAGADIPIEARILAVADCYDAMTSERPYKRALTRSEAIEELRRGCGGQFDAQVVEAFLRVLPAADAPGTEREVGTSAEVI